MRCTNCETENPENNAVCRDCGRPLHAQLVCSDCQHVNTADRKFCSMCGAPLVVSAIRPGLRTQTPSPTEEHKTVIRRIIQRLNVGDLAVIDECMTADFVRHSAGAPDLDREGYKQLLSRTGIGVPGSAFHSTINDIIAEGDGAAFRCTHRVTPAPGITKTAEPLVITEAYFSRFEGGKVAEWWNIADVQDSRPSNRTVKS